MPSINSAEPGERLPTLKAVSTRLLPISCRTHIPGSTNPLALRYMGHAMTNVVGWLSTLVLLATLSRQVFIQWHDENSKGVSAWLFIGQMSSSVGFIAYSVLVGNKIFIVTNSLIAAVAIIGELVFLKNQKRTARRRGS